MGFAVPDDTVLISDGGLATELEARGHDLSDALWSARLLLDAPDEISAVHAAFYRAGAVIATTASYQASFDGFATRGIDRSGAERLLRRSVGLAAAARDQVEGSDSGIRRWVAASVGPYGAALADGSEYRGRYGLTVAQLRNWHRPRLEVLADAGADVLACETVPDIDEAQALVSLLQQLGVPAWLSYTIDGMHTRAAQPLADAFAVAAGVPEIVAVGVNCCAPGDVLPAIDVARAVFGEQQNTREQERSDRRIDTREQGRSDRRAPIGKPVIVYPNNGQCWDARARAWVGPSRFSAGLAPRWVAAGARIVGGCCRVRPADIAAIAAVA